MKVVSQSPYRVGMFVIATQCKIYSLKRVSIPLSGRHVCNVYDYEKEDFKYGSQSPYRVGMFVIWNLGIFEEGNKY